ncbi:MAG TPA: MlaD family protein [Burkholderiales bacterium]
MTDSQKNSEAADDPVDKLPRAKVNKHRWSFPVIWVVPVIAALVAGYLVYDQVREFGPKITIRFKDGSGLKPGRTLIQYNGVRIGEVKSVKLSEDLREVVVEVRLIRSAASVAREGSVFWIARLGTELQDISNLGTVITGAYIQVVPGTGEPKSDFVGLEASQAASLEPGGLELVLHTVRLGSLKPTSPVYYRGIEVGAVRAVQLSSDATVAEIHVTIKPRYVKLVRSSSKFWNASGADVKFGLFSGLEINVESLKSLVGGGIVFATQPDPKSRQARNGEEFPLYDQPAKEWLEWAPKILIPSEKSVRKREERKKEQHSSEAAASKHEERAQQSPEAASPKAK